jgi:hypothetical protein
MRIPPRHPALNFVGGLIVLVAAISPRFWYAENFGFESASGRGVWQVQGQDLVVLPPNTTGLDRLIYNLQSQGSPQGLQTPHPFGPKAGESYKDEPLAGRGPLYPFFRYYIEWSADEYLVDFMPPHAAVRMVHIAMGALTCLLYYVIALRAFGNHFRIAILVGLATAFYPFWVINTSELEDGTLASLLLAWSLAVGVKIGQKGGVVRSYFYGLLLAALALTRAALLPFAVVGLLWFFIRCRRVSHGGLCAILSFLGFATGIGPWAVWTTQQHGTPIPVASTAWFDVWAGSHVWVGTNYTLADHVADGRTMKLSDLDEQVSADLLARLQNRPVAERYQLLAPVVYEEITANPVNYLYQRVRSLSQFFFGVRTPRQAIINQALAPIAIPPFIPVSLYVSLFGMLFLALLGWRWTYGWRFHAAPLTLAIYWIPLPYLLTHAGPLHSARLPLDGVFIVLAVVGLIGLIPGLGARLLAGEDHPEAKESARG